MSPSAPSTQPAPQTVTPGIYTPVVTFYKKDGTTIDYDTQIAHARYLQQNGITGLVAMGSSGENALLTQKERVQIISALHRALPDFPIIGGVAHNNIEETIQYIQDYKDAGATSAMVLPSSYYGVVPSQEGIYDWLAEVADSAPLPILLYIYPGVCNGLHILPDTVKRLSAHPNIIGCKCTHGDVQQYARIGLDDEIQANNFSLLSGLGQLLLPLHSVNGKGVIDALSGAFPKTFVALFKALESHDVKTARKLQLVASEAEELGNMGNLLSVKRAVRDNLGFGESLVGRKPLNHAIPDDVWDKQYKRYYDLIKNVEDSL